MTDDPSLAHHRPWREDEDLQWPPTPKTIRLMGEHTVQVPLWSEVGLMYAGPESLVETENRYHFVYQP